MRSRWLVRFELRRLVEELVSAAQKRRDTPSCYAPAAAVKDALRFGPWRAWRRCFVRDHQFFACASRAAAATLASDRQRSCCRGIGWSLAPRVLGESRSSPGAARFSSSTAPSQQNLGSPHSPRSSAAPALIAIDALHCAPWGMGSGSRGGGSPARQLLFARFAWVRTSHFGTS